MVKKRIKKKQNKNIIGNILWGILIIGLIAIIALIVLFKMDVYTPQWLDFLSPIQMEQLAPITNAPLLASCSQVCSGFNNNYAFVNECKIGETKMVYGYPNQPAILTCCCYDIVAPPIVIGTCTDSDGGQDDQQFIKGTVTTSNPTSTFTDECNWGTGGVTEYYCDGVEAKQSNIMCEDYWTCQDGKCAQQLCEDIMSPTVDKCAAGYTTDGGTCAYWNFGGNEQCISSF